MTVQGHRTGPFASGNANSPRAKPCPIQSSNSWPVAEITAAEHPMLSTGAILPFSVRSPATHSAHSGNPGRPKRWTSADQISLGSGRRTKVRDSDFAEPTARKTIDPERLDDLFLMSFAEEFGVDQPGRRPMAQGTLLYFHGLTSCKKGAKSRSLRSNVWLALTAGVDRCGMPLLAQSQCGKNRGGQG